MAMLALSVTASAPASAALPEFNGTFPTTYEFTLSQPTFESTGGQRLACQSATGAGRISGPKTVEAVKWHLLGCELDGSWKCNSAGAKEGEVVSSAINGTLVYLSKAKTEVGVAYSPREPKTLEEGLVPPVTFASAECKGGGGSLVIRRTLLAHLSPVNVNASRFEQWFVGKGGHSVPESYENEGHTFEAVSELMHNSVPFEKADLNAPTEGHLTTGSTIEVKA
jgi:hypothetical protein